MLEVVKSLNNNIILAIKDGEKEVVAFGTGIGFKRKKGDLVDISQSSKLFQAEEDVQMREILEGISPEILIVTKEVIELAEKKLNCKLNSSVLFTLADHLQFAIQRHDEEIVFENALQWEIPHLYYDEYQLGIQAIALINERLGINLPEAEATFIGLHFVNAQATDGQTMGDTIQITQVTKQIVKIIQKLFDRLLDKTTFSYSRFITHIRYFIMRQKNGEQTHSEIDEMLKEIIQERYIKSYACGLMIKEMFKKEYNWEISEDELAYLVIHIERLVKENK